jgi:hypothetical protein
MITEYPAEDWRYDQPKYEPFWTAAAALDLKTAALSNFENTGCPHYRVGAIVTTLAASPIPSGIAARIASRT